MLRGKTKSKMLKDKLNKEVVTMHEKIYNWTVFRFKTFITLYISPLHIVGPRFQVLTILL